MSCCERAAGGVTVGRASHSEPTSCRKKVGAGFAIAITLIALTAIALIIFLPHVAIIGAAVALVGKAASIAIFAVIAAISTVVAIFLLKKPCNSTPPPADLHVLDTDVADV
jgi:hypothetical protein